MHVVVEGLENDLEVVEVVEDEFDGTRCCPR